MRFTNHRGHIDILKEYYHLNKYYLTEQLKDTILDAIECMEYVEKNVADNSSTYNVHDIPDEDNTYDQQELQKYIKKVWDECEADRHICPQCGGVGKVNTLFSQKICPGCKGVGTLPRLIGLEGFPERYQRNL